MIDDDNLQEITDFYFHHCALLLFSLIKTVFHFKFNVKKILFSL